MGMMRMCMAVGYGWYRFPFLPVWLCYMFYVFVILSCVKSVTVYHCSVLYLEQKYDIGVKIPQG